MAPGANFGIVDYCMLGGTMAVSLAIGLYHGFRGNKTAEDFAMGSRSMRPLPVSLSLLATFLSANTILGYSGEVYDNDLMLAWSIPGTIIAILFAAEVVLPVLYPLKLVTPNQYLELRFESPWLRRLSMAMTVMSITVFMGLALYAPTLALAAVTPLSSYTYIWIMGIVVTIYASVGGLKAVVWADAFQMVLMVTGVLVVTVMSCWHAGGLSKAWQVAAEGGRTEGLIIDMDPHTRHTVWNVFLLTLVNWGSHYSVSQANYQRVSSVPSLQQAKRVLYYNIIGMSAFLCVLFLMGICIYAVYAGCDPITRGLIFSKDQIAVYFVSDKLSHLPGLSGIFVATLLSAALSSVSSGMNTLATLLWADIFSHMPCFRGSSEFVAATASKLITVFLGALFVGLAFLASKMGGLVQAGYTVVGVMSGPVLGVYMLGMAFPFCNKMGAFAGILFGWAFIVWIAMGSMLYQPRPTLLPFTVDNCPSSHHNLTNLVTVIATTIRNNTSVVGTKSSNATTLGNATISTFVACDPSGDLSCVADDEPFLLLDLYKVSYALYPLIGLITCLVVGILVSLATGYQDPSKVPSELVLVFLRRFTAKARDVEDGDSPPAKLTKSGTVETLVMDPVGSLNARNKPWRNSEGTRQERPPQEHRKQCCIATRLVRNSEPARQNLSAALIPPHDFSATRN